MLEANQDSDDMDIDLDTAVLIIHMGSIGLSMDSFDD